MTATLGTEFWDKLSQISNSLGMDPKDLLAVMYSESGLDPEAHNRNGNASGLIQFMPETLKGLNFSGNHSDFRELDAVQQLDYVEKYVRNQMKINGGSFKSAAQYYVANFLPIALELPGIQQGNPNTVIVEKDPTYKKYKNLSLDKERLYYNANTSLDVDKDGKITLGDLEKIMDNVKKSSGYQHALSQLENGKEYIAGKTKSPEANPSNSSNEIYNQVNSLLDTFLSALSTRNNSIIKQADLKKLTSNNILIKINSNSLINKLEFARVLSLAINEETLSKTTIHTNKDNVEISTTIYGPTKLCLSAISQLSNTLSEIFEEATKNIGYVKVNTNVFFNKKSSYQKLDIKLAQLAYRMFKYNFIK